MIILTPRNRRHELVFAAWLVAIIVITALLSPPVALADADDKVIQHLAAAEEARSKNDFWRAAIEYQQAAEESDDVDVARQATQFAFTYGFNKEARVSAKRWVVLDKSSDEALLYILSEPTVKMAITAQQMVFRPSLREMRLVSPREFFE